MRLLAELNEQGMTIVLVTHEHDIAAWAKRRIIFRDGHDDRGPSPAAGARACRRDAAGELGGRRDAS